MKFSARIVKSGLRGSAGLARDRRGNALAVTAAALPIVIGAMGLGVDFTQWIVWKRNLQGAADAAALAGAQSLNAGVAWTNVQTDATRLINGNASNTAIPRSMTQVNRIQSTGQIFGAGQTAATHGTAVEVVLQAPGRLYFAGLFLASQPTIRARAVAGPAGNGNACFLALGTAPSYSDEALRLEDATINAPGCGFHSNSNAVQSIQRWGNGSFTGSTVSAVGEVTGSYASPTVVKENQSPIADPYGPAGRNLQAPNVSSGGTSIGCTKSCGGPRTVSPPSGNHCISNNDSNKFTIEDTNVTMSPGVYVFCGGADTVLNISSGIVNGAGVSIVLLNGMRMEVNNNAQLNLQAMTTAQAAAAYPGDANRRALAGILFWQVHQSNPSDKPNMITGNTVSTNLQGAFYSPHSQFELHGNLGTQGCMQLVAETIHVKGNANLQNNCASLNDPAFTHFGAGAVALVA